MSLETTPPVSYQIVVRQVFPQVGDSTGRSEQIFEQTVTGLDLKKVIDAVNYKKRERKPRTTRNPNLTPG